MNKRLRQSDEGAMLVFALIIITTVALVTGAVLTHGWTNLSATVSLRGVAGTSYAGDAAAKVAINNLRMGSSAPGFAQSPEPGDDAPWVYSNNLDGTGCFGLDGTLPRTKLVLNNLQPAAGDQTADTSTRVECSVVPGTGLFGGGGGVDTDGSMRAITIFDGDLTVQNNSMLQVRGGIASNGAIDADNAAGTGIFTNGYVWANGGCSGTIVTTKAKDCSHADVSDPVVPEVFTSTAGVTPRVASAQSCTAFQPGFYGSAAELTAKVDACGTAVFVPGDYYFDFGDEAVGSGQNVWSINKTVIGGQLTGSGEPPGRCRSPIDEDDAVGVRFVFGGSSRILVGQDAHVELCGTYVPDTVPVVLQQQGVSTTSTNGTQSVKASTVATTGSTPGWSATPTAAMLNAVDASDAQWPGNSNGSPKGVLTLTNLTPSPAIPAGSRLTGATLKVHHKEQGGTQVAVNVSAGSDTYTTTLPLRSVSALNQPYPVAATDDLAIPTGPLLTALAKAVRDGTLSTATPTVELSLAGKNKSMAIDSVSLELTWTTWALNQATNNNFLTGFGNSYKGDFVLQGTLYAPHGAVDVNFGNNADTVVAFRYGLAVRSALLAGHPQVLYGYPLVSIPDEGSGLGRRVTAVDLKVFVCVQAATCSTGGTHTLTVRALIKDPPWAIGGEPVPGQRQIKIVGWSEQK
jgi:hypothetical protein